MHATYKIERLMNTSDKYRGTTFPATAREGLQDCETWRFPHFPYNRFTDDRRFSASHSDRPLPAGRFLSRIYV